MNFYRTLMNNKLFLSKTQSYLIGLKNEYFKQKIHEIEIMDICKNITELNNLIPNEIKILRKTISAVYSKISKDDLYILFSVTNLLFDVFGVKDYQKPYIISIVRENSKINESQKISVL